eukprot:4251714-Prymnesium_polylepis.2
MQRPYRAWMQRPCRAWMQRPCRAWMQRPSRSDRVFLRAPQDDGEADAAPSDKEASARGYDYLLGMPLWSLTVERVEQLQAQVLAKEAELQQLVATTPKQ